jgi:hypothetical protein
MEPFNIRSDSFDSVVSNGVVAGLSLAGVLWLGWELGWPWVFDPDDPQFNPLLIFVGILLAIAGFYGGKAVLWSIRSKRYGVTEIELDGSIPVALGGSLSGRLRFARPLMPQGDWTLELTCFDVHEYADWRKTVGGPFRQDAYPVWRELLAVPADSEPVEALPFCFDLPASVGPDTVAPLHRGHSNFSYTASIHIPGMRRVASHNQPPVARYWTLAVSAPMASESFHAEFTLPVGEGKTARQA